MDGLIASSSRTVRQPFLAAEDDLKEEAGSAYLRKFKKEHRGARKSWDLPHDFPNWRVITAYTEVGFCPHQPFPRFTLAQLTPHSEHEKGVHLQTFCPQPGAEEQETDSELALSLLSFQSLKRIAWRCQVGMQL